jgi:hypothetical protein
LLRLTSDPINGRMSRISVATATPFQDAFENTVMFRLVSDVNIVQYFGTLKVLSFNPTTAHAEIPDHATGKSNVIVDIRG